MPQPGVAAVHVNRPLTNISVAYIQTAMRSSMAAVAFPIVPVEKQSDRYFVYNKGDFLRDEAEIRAPGAESAGSGYALDSTPNYFCPDYALHKDVTDDEVANSDDPLQPMDDAAEFIAQKLMIRREKLWAANFFTTSKWATDITPTTLWDAAGSTPLRDVATGVDTILQSTGMKPNTLILGRKVFTGLCENTSIKEMIKYTQKGVVTEEILAALLKVDRVLVGDMIENTAAQGQTASGAFILGKHALLCYAAPKPSLKQPSAGYTISWRGAGGPTGTRNAIGIATRRFRMEHLKSERVESEFYFDMKLIASDCGYFFPSAVS